MNEQPQRLPEERWTVYKASQYLPAVLSDPNKGKQSNFFTRTWGDNFVDKTIIEKSPFLPEITYAHFEHYVRKYGRRLKRHQILIDKLKETTDDNNKLSMINHETSTATQNKLNLIPIIYMQNNFHLNDPKIFNQVFENKAKSEHELQDELSHYLDIVEEQIAKQVSLKSGAFFHAMTSHDTIMEEMRVATDEVKFLRAQMKLIDRNLTIESLKLLANARSKNNHKALVNKLKLISTVLQTQPMLQLLMSSSDYVGALELISGTQEVLAKDLAGVTSLRHLPSQLKEMSKLINKMLYSEFERYAAADLHRPLNSEGVLEQERLVSLVAGLLRQSDTKFLEIYKKEALTAAQIFIKQLMIEQLADSKLELSELKGSGEITPIMDSTHWLKVLKSGSEALGKLMHRVKAVYDVLKETTDINSGINRAKNSNISPASSEHFLTEEEHAKISGKLQNLLIQVCDYYNDRLATLVNNTQNDRGLILGNHEFNELSTIVQDFTNLSESISGKPNAVLRGAFKIQASSYVNKFHQQRKIKLNLLLDNESWKSAEVPMEIQLLIDKLAQGEVIKSLPSSPSSSVHQQINHIKNEKPSQTLKVSSQDYVIVGTVLILIQLVAEYCVCAYDIKFLLPVIGKNLAELLSNFNGKSCKQVLVAGALQTAGLRTITSTNLALASRSLQLVLWMIPHIRNHFQILLKETFTGFDSVENEIANHIQQLERKILSIINTLVGVELFKWEAKPPIPSEQFRNITKQLTKLHEAVSYVLPDEQVKDIYQEMHKNFKTRIRDQILKLNIKSDGGPQHGLVNTEIIFYLQTMKILKVLPDKLINSDNAMDEIWDR